MAPSPDLFVVCKNCQAEVSPYITECPYCGHRLRKRAPKLEKGGTPKQPRRRRSARADKPQRLARLRTGEIPGIRGDHRPYASLSLFLVPAVVTLIATFGLVDVGALLIVAGWGGDPWRLVTTTLFYGSTGYEIAALAACFLFGWLLERRHGWWAPLLVYLVGAALGSLAAISADAGAFVAGGNAGALALLGAWVVRDAVAARRGEETETDWLAVGAAAVILLLLPAAFQEANAIAGLTGAVAGLLLGIPLARLRER